MEKEYGSRVVYGFHGTSEAAARAILSEGFVLSANKYDWLGDGVYFFQDAPGRALEWAQRVHGHEVAVVGAKIDLVDCMDLLDIEWFKVLSDSYDRFLDRLKQSGLEAPRQTAGAHRLDREVINYCLGVLGEEDIHVRSVRAAFQEGQPAFPLSAIFNRSHVQLAVRDLEVIRETWLEKVGDE